MHRFGPAGPARVLAIHGLTGHGQRWQTLADRHLPEFAIVAPDLIGHGHSSWAAPWTIDANVAALAAVVDGEGPVVVVGHSFGGALALRLAADRPDLVSRLVLLDPAVGLDGEWMRQIADDMFASPDYTDRAEARAEKANGSGVRWSPPNWTANSTSTSSTCPTAGSAGGSASRRRCRTGASWRGRRCCRPREFPRRWCAPPGPCRRTRPMS
ncbi:lysophospholipase [Mycolicibacterium phlei RIVM601174]|nr:lysophospholipase [Mycolicibacterium phlei RIVM601174]